MRPLLAVLHLVMLSAFPGVAAAGDVTAADWQADCAAYIGILTGTGDGDDLEITYCMGQTLGIVDGLETGSRIGALSMASVLAVVLGLDSEKVFRLFNEVSTEELLGYCAPADYGGSQTIRDVADYLARNPGKGSLPVTMVFFEALQEAYPCAPADEQSEAPGGTAVPGPFGEPQQDSSP